jgi:hypothetical protein
MRGWCGVGLAAVILLASSFRVVAAAVTNFVNFETAPVHPVAFGLGPNGPTLAVCNLPDNRVEIFNVS